MHGSSSPPWGRSREYCRGPITSQVITPPLSKNREHNVEIERGTCPTTTSPLTTATAYGSEIVWRRRPFYAPPENKRVWFALYSALVQSYRNPVQPIKTVYDQLTALLCEYVIQDMSRSLIDIIKEVGSSLGYARLKEEQYAVIKDLIDGQDVFAALPTGFGKSVFCLFTWRF